VHAQTAVGADNPNECCQRWRWLPPATIIPPAHICNNGARQCTMDILAGVGIATCTALWATVVQHASRETFALAFVFVGVAAGVYLTITPMSVVDVGTAMIMAVVLGGYQTALHTILTVASAVNTQGLVNLNVVLLMCYEAVTTQRLYNGGVWVSVLVVIAASMHIASARPLIALNNNIGTE